MTNHSKIFLVLLAIELWLESNGIKLIGPIIPVATLFYGVAAIIAEFIQQDMNNRRNK
jgi:hypothetical protein